MKPQNFQPVKKHQFALRRSIPGIKITAPTGSAIEKHMIAQKAAVGINKRFPKRKV